MFVTTTLPKRSISRGGGDTATCVYTNTLASLVNGTPQGSTFTESFGDSSSLCWAGGPSSCDQLWIAPNGAAQSIVATPGTPPQNTASANSLPMPVAAGAKRYHHTPGNFPQHP